MKKSFYFLIFYLFLHIPLSAQTNSGTITQSGWYRIAINGPLVSGSTGGSRAAARFILKDVTAGLHQTVEFLGYVHFGGRPAIAVLNNSYFSSATPTFKKIRIIEGSTYSGSAVEVYIIKNSSRDSDVSYYLENNIQDAGWTAVDWQLITTASSDNGGVPSGFNARVIDLNELVQGYVTDSGQHKSFFNGDFYTSGSIGIGVASPQAPLDVRKPRQVIQFATGDNTSAYTLKVGLQDDGVNMENSSSIRGFNFKNHNGTLMTITSAGNVGIGTITPNAKLAVNGAVSAKKITVTQNGWPDYVFGPEYSLPSLDSLDAYVRERRHLPDLPSADEISQKGNDLGQTDVLLLKKIEELTLYVIQQNRRIDSLEKKLSEQNTAGNEK
ncbi:hypothetical protein [Compostibacter hankyongensis]|uniref:Uncharacterized protein n=1 Tax=Compostibacter hankyongensis TaxID=1007089 RepID=A0ABP8G018_9BACT